MTRSIPLAIAFACGTVAFSLVTPASASPPAPPFENCSIANSAGYCNIPASSPNYGPWLDPDKDGIACEC